MGQFCCMKQQQSSTWGFRSISFWMTLPVAAGIIIVGFGFFIDPAGWSRNFGIPFCEGKVQLYGNVKGIRDMFSGLIFLYLLWIRARRTTAVLFSMAILIPLTDCITVGIANGLGDQVHLWIHGGTALYMLMTGILLFRGGNHVAG